MNNPRKREPSEVFLSNLAESISAAASEDKSFLKDELQAYSYDIEDVKKRGRMFIKTQVGKLRMARAKERRERLLKRASEIYNSVIKSEDKKGNLKQWLIDEFGNALSKDTVQAFYHKLDSIEGSDMESLQQDVELLEIFNRFEEESEKEDNSE